MPTSYMSRYKDILNEILANQIKKLRQIDSNVDNILWSA